MDWAGRLLVLESGGFQGAGNKEAPQSGAITLPSLVTVSESPGVEVPRAAGSGYQKTSGLQPCIAGCFSRAPVLRQIEG